MAASMWKNSLKNVESDNNKILYETLLDFLQRNGTCFLNKPRTFIGVLYIMFFVFELHIRVCSGFLRVIGGTVEIGIEFFLNTVSERYRCIGPFGVVRCRQTISQQH
jgi:hypothetical protein